MIAYCASFAKSVQPLGMQLLRSSSTIYCIHMKYTSTYNSRMKNKCQKGRGEKYQPRFYRFSNSKM